MPCLYLLPIFGGDEFMKGHYSIELWCVRSIPALPQQIDRFAAIYFSPFPLLLL
jgi:hypothetical protein